MVRTFIITLIDCCFFDERGMVGKEPFDTRPHAQKMQKFIPNLMKIGQNSSGNDFQPHRRRVDLIGEGKRRRSPMGLEVVAIQEWEHMRSHDDVLWPIRMRYSKGSHRRTRLPETLTTPIVCLFAYPPLFFPVHPKFIPNNLFPITIGSMPLLFGRVRREPNSILCFRKRQDDIIGGLARLDLIQ